MSQTIKKAIQYLEERFGIPPEVFENYALLDEGDIWITSKEAASLEIKTWKRKGIRLVRVFKKGFKFTTTGMQLFGKFATRNVVELDSVEELQDFLAGKDLRKSVSSASEGQVIVKYGNDIIGSGLYKNGKIKNQIPKGRRIV